MSPLVWILDPICLNLSYHNYHYFINVPFSFLLIPSSSDCLLGSSLCKHILERPLGHTCWRRVLTVSLSENALIYTYSQEAQSLGVPAQVGTRFLLPLKILPSGRPPGLLEEIYLFLSLDPCSFMVFSTFL